MMESGFFQVATVIGYAIESVGVVVIVVGSIMTTINWLRTRHELSAEEQYHVYRRNLARMMMLGLEFLVAGDIIRTVVVGHSLSDLLALALVVVIRTVLVFTLHLEMEGRWPWQPAPEDRSA